MTPNRFESIFVGGRAIRITNLSTSAAAAASGRPSVARLHQLKPRNPTQKEYESNT